MTIGAAVEGDKRGMEVTVTTWRTKNFAQGHATHSMVAEGASIDQLCLDHTGSGVRKGMVLFGEQHSTYMTVVESSRNCRIHISSPLKTRSNQYQQILPHSLCKVLPLAPRTASLLYK